jgi:hypothetical protein
MSTTSEAVMKKWFVAFCWLGFLITFGAGLGMFAAPEMNASMLGMVVPEAGFNPYFVRMLAAVLIPVSLCYLFALYDPDASRSLIILVTSEKILAVLYSVGAFVAGTVNVKVFAVILGDGALALVGLYAAINFYRIVETLDSGDDDDDECSCEETQPKKSS